MPTTPRLGQRAVIIGASMAGLLAARVLAERFDEVVLLERDELPTGAQPRKGTPQAVHPHGLLARGRLAMEELFPGFTQALLDQGALSGDLQQDVGFAANGQRFAIGVAGEQGLGVSRLAIEAELRRRVRALPGVRLRDGVDVVAPELDGTRRRVTAVRLIDRHSGEGQTLTADLVLDCSGRGSRTPAWLDSWGFDKPDEERVEIGICYASAYFRREGAWALGEGIHIAALICTATNELPRPAVMIAQEPGADGVPRWVVGLGGYAGDHPAGSFDGLRERARQIGSPELVALTHEATPIGEPMRYQFPYSLRRHYERLARFPERYLVLGDAQTSFNPIYGQGMTVAACEALALRDALGRGLDGLHRRYFKAAARVIDIPWQLAVGGDLAIDTVPGPRPLPVRIVNAYVRRLYHRAPHDPVVTRAFLEVVHMIKAPPSLFAPRILARVLFGRNPPAAVQPAPRLA